MRIAFDPGYDIAVEVPRDAHPFDARRASRAVALLRAGADAGLLEKALLPVDREASAFDLRLVHSEAHLASLRDPAVIAAACELDELRRLPHRILEDGLLRPVRLAVRGTALAAREAIREGLAANLFGGFHHAGPSSAEGFCLLNDVAVAIAALRSMGVLRGDQRVLYVDLDAHLGNGVAHCFLGDRRVGILDLHNASAYPRDDRVAHARVDWHVGLPPGTGDDDYLAALRPALLSAMAAGPWALAVINLGTDVIGEDWVGGLEVTEDGTFERDRFAISTLRTAGVPVLVVPGGGYTEASHRMLARTLSWALSGADRA